MIVGKKICAKVGKLERYQATAFYSKQGKEAGKVKIEFGLKVFFLKFYIFRDFLTSVVYRTCFINQGDSSCPSSN